MEREFKRVYQFKVSIRHIKPVIWRRIQVPETYTFWDLHVAIQDSFDWLDYHLHEFIIAKPKTGAKVRIICYEDEFEGFSRTTLFGRIEKISKYFSLKNNTAEYNYDFGDNWQHALKLEKILPRKEDVCYPVCIGGKRARPPEDCGGLGGYEDFLEIIRNPEHEEYEETIEWAGGKFDPEYFDIKKISFDDPEERWEYANSDD
jgi:hypothetical protein